jgi:hypothetical protein
MLLNVFSLMFLQSFDGLLLLFDLLSEDVLILKHRRPRGQRQAAVEHDDQVL